MPVTKNQTHATRQNPQPKTAKKPAPEPAPVPAPEPAKPQTYLTHKKTGKVRRKNSIPPSDHAEFRPATPHEIALAGY